MIVLTNWLSPYKSVPCRLYQGISHYIKGFLVGGSDRYLRRRNWQGQFHELANVALEPWNLLGPFWGFQNSHTCTWQRIFLSFPLSFVGILPTFLVSLRTPGIQCQVDSLHVWHESWMRLGNIHNESRYRFSGFKVYVTWRRLLHLRI